MHISRLILLLIAAAGVSAAMPLHGGHFGIDAIILVTVGFVAIVMALLGVRFAWAERFVEKGYRQIFIAVILLQAVLVVPRPAAYVVSKDVSFFNWFYVFFGVFVVIAICTAMPRNRLGRWHKWLLLATFVLPGAWVLHWSSNPYIDTFTVHQESCEALARGVNPYGIHVTNLYGEAGTQWLPPEFVTNEKMLFGYPYPPVTLLLSMPGYLAMGDARWSMLAAIVVAAGLMAWIGRGEIGLMAAAVFLTFSRMFEVIESSWTETYLVMLLAIGVFAAMRKSTLLPWLVGLLLVSKQYTVLMAPATLLLLPWPLKWKNVWRFYSKAATAAIVVTLPFLFTAFDGFMAGVVKMHLAARPRDDSLSFSAFFSASEWGGAASMVAFAACFAVQGMALKLAPRSAFGFALTVSAASFALFIVGKGFMNYYFFIFGSMCCAIAAVRIEHDAVVNGEQAAAPALQHSPAQ